MKKRAKILIISGSAVLLTALLVCCLVIPLVGKSVMLYPPREAMYVTPSDLGMDYETVAVPTEDGLLLSGWLVEPKDPLSDEADVTLVVFHGATHSKAFVLDHYGKGFHDLGYRLLFVDSRNRGESPETKTGLTWGIDEAKDAAAAVDFTRSFQDADGSKVVLFAESQGAAMALFYAAGDCRADAVIADSSWAYGDAMIRRAYPVRSGFPWFPFGMITVKMMESHYGFSFRDISPADIAGTINVPVFIIHGDADIDIDPGDAPVIFGNLKPLPGNDLWLVPGAGHVEGYKNPEYFIRVGRFVRNATAEE